MRLKKIKLSGFKSFVDPTTIPVSSSLIGVVGPNGCGKSNIIDAVRWVMGESSAKHLRGDSMADVIFSGSNSRKPVGKAAVELVFENNDGRAPGQYAAFAEIAIRREAARDGQSTYFINKTRCRRKDITDLFLGTGLGPRTYSIIEQGMVTRIVEAKPEDLRGFLEEAAGISKYKERRRETENRIRHTRENLERLEDIRGELEGQLQKLQRQSKAAAKYKDLKQEERLLRAQLLVLRWADLDRQAQVHVQELSHRETEMEAMLARQRETEAEIESLRSQHTEATDTFNTVQESYYALGADITGIEQQIQHASETHAQRQQDQEQVNQAWEQASAHLQSDKTLQEELITKLQAATPVIEAGKASYEAAQTELQQAENALQNWQQEWQEFNTLAAEPEKAMDIQRSRIEQIKGHLVQNETRSSRLQSELFRLEQTLEQAGIESLRLRADTSDREAEQLEQNLESIEQGIQQARNQGDEVSTLLDGLRGEFQSSQARLASLQELQDAAQGKHDEALNSWIAQHGLDSAVRLSAAVAVEAGWERAVERVLGSMLAGVCVADLNNYAQDAASLEQSELLLIESRTSEATAQVTDSLSAKLTTDIDLSSMLSSVQTAESMDEALSRRQALADHESIITRQGVWVGKNWIHLGVPAGGRAGMLERERDMDVLKESIAELESSIEQQQQLLESFRSKVKELEGRRDATRKALNEASRTRTDVHAALNREEARLAQLTERQQQIQQEQEEISKQHHQDNDTVQQAQHLLREAEQLSGSHGEKREHLQSSREVLQQSLDQARREVTLARDALHEHEIEQQRLTTTLDSTRQSVERLETQLQQLIQRRDELATLLAEGENPELALQEKLEATLQQRLSVEEKLNTARESVSGLDHAIRDQEKARGQQEKSVQAIREILEKGRMARQELLVRRDTLEEQLHETEMTLQQVQAEIPEEANEQEWAEHLQKITRRIDRLGPINLVAIEEFNEQSARKSYLDKQFEDLSQALETLAGAIHKIDKETRTRFKETFDRVNTGFQTFFPKLFGGGHAYLELTGDDLLDTGVTVMARPPGKRNSTIHLLSGGEKALTAVSLVFSIFQLNPAPFCLLDEVDAPLDDANVERYCDTLKEMSSETQLLYVTHNKITMEMAELLLGVTMSEPGVSRLVAVDVDAALEMVV
ncbi:MAG: chromosome segregation protein SMC [Gammaproteobacteria bacterium]|nr:MAG: chromosome segregation protein SMC [Gammaproteobacteria bacterium]